jgi:hypothetical protein
MAVYQFQFVLIPAAGIARIHSDNVDFIEEYATRNPDAEVDLDEESPNYWEGIDKKPLQETIAGLLPVCESWSEEAVMYGNSEGDHIQIWDNTVDVALDARNLSAPLLVAITDAARAQDCKLVLKDGGKVISPNLDEVVAGLNASSAMRFLRDPAGFLKGCR